VEVFRADVEVITTASANDLIVQSYEHFTVLECCS